MTAVDLQVAAGIKLVAARNFCLEADKQHDAYHLSLSLSLSAFRTLLS